MDKRTTGRSSGWYRWLRFQKLLDRESQVMERRQFFREVAITAATLMPLTGKVLGRDMMPEPIGQALDRRPSQWGLLRD